MAKLTPSYLWAETATGTSAPDTLTNLGFVAGDVLIVFQLGTAAGAGAPVAPTGVTMDTGNKTSGTIAYTNSGTSTRGRTQVWARQVQSGDLSGTVTVNTTGFTAHRWGLMRFNHADGFGGIADFVAQVVNGTDTNNSIASYCLSSTGSTVCLLNDVSRPACVLSFYSSNSTGQASQTIAPDSGAGRTPYFDGNSGNTSTSAGHSNHHGTGTNICWADYNEYDASDTISNEQWVAGVSNSTHASAFVVIQTRLNIQANFLDNTPTFFQPQVSSTQTIDLNFLDNTVSVLTPSIQGTQTVNLNFIDNSVAIFQPTVQFATQNLVMQLIDTSQIFLPVSWMYWQDEIPMNSPSATQRVVQANLTGELNYPGDIGDLQIGVKQSGSFIAGPGSFTALAYGSSTVVSQSVSPPATGTGFSIWFQTRTNDAVDPIISAPQLVVQDLVSPPLLTTGQAFTPLVFFTQFVGTNLLDASATMLVPAVLSQGQIGPSGALQVGAMFTPLVEFEQFVNTNLLNNAPVLFLATVGNVQSIGTLYLSNVPAVFLPQVEQVAQSESGLIVFFS